MKPFSSPTRALRLGLSLSLIAVLTACGGGGTLADSAALADRAALAAKAPVIRCAP